ncbi:Predicted ATPase of the ABC class [Saccharopolyspora kobensis]|uniref:Predicted ATPase of the ABC class n=2 Tax=Saccharopolyspora kobensis TaxID=146035 RepID=A0A1H5WE11_9PSEU|nr:ABC-ATPase domain-containing protein [Saccharopolyspora kobensis]SEF97613.1 Predicted ATPase of the ABC class [Saccharopolyspora kobensis]SFD74837.1 Predicted ATPase of the ABC class [Saccharopolyspora kobensis]
MAQRAGDRAGRHGYRRRPDDREPTGGPRGDEQALRQELRAMHGASYGRYKSLRGQWHFPGFTLQVQRVQPDPFAPASRCEVRVTDEVAGFPEQLWCSPVRARALAGYLVRVAHRHLGDSRLRVDAGGQQVLDRSACQVQRGEVVLRLGIDLPGRGRTIDGRQAERALCDELPEVVETALRWATADQERVREFVASVEDTDALRRQLPGLGLIAFVADGAMLPRRSGVDERPLPGGVPFSAPESMRVSVELPNRGRVSGMGVPEGITLIVGGGFHGKSTLLRALEFGVYDHVPGDGRELVVCRAETVKIRAEDGRRVHRVDVSPFVSHLPTGADTADFSTDNASGSTSQAAAIVEAVEAGAKALLVDEDTAATNLMIRDARMQALVAKDAEPLTPFVDLIRPLRAAHAVSTVLVMGGSGDYMDVADQVVMLEDYHARDVTARARQLAAQPTGRRSEADTFPPVRHRVVDPRSIPTDRPKVRARGVDALTLGESTVELRGVEQLVDPAQVTGIGLALVSCARRGVLDGSRTVAEVLEAFAADVAERGIAAVDDRHVGDFAVPRPLDLAAALNRLRALRISGFRS